MPNTTAIRATIMTVRIVLTSLTLTCAEQVGLRDY
jgi:hypothetical protein